MLDHKNTSQPLRSCPTCCWFKTRWLSVRDHINSSKPLICRVYIYILPAVGSKTVRRQYRVTATHRNAHTATPLHAYTYILRPVDCRITRAKCTTQPRALQAHCNCSVQRTTGRTSLMASPSQQDVHTPLHLAARSVSINQSSPAAKWHSHWIMLIILANEC